MTSLFTRDGVEPALKTVSLEFLHYPNPQNVEESVVVGRAQFLIKDAIQKGGNKDGGKFFI